MTRTAYFFSNGLMLMLLCSHRLYWSRYFGVLLDFCSDNPFLSVNLPRKVCPSRAIGKKTATATLNRCFTSAPPVISGLPRQADVTHRDQHVRKVPILLQKSAVTAGYRSAIAKADRL